MISRNYQWLFFDADGTLFDFEKSQAIALEQVFRHHEIPYNLAHLAKFQEINHGLWRALERREVTAAELKVRRFQLLLEVNGLKNDPGAFGEIYLQYLGTCPEMIEGAVELIKELHRKYRIAILTNGLKKVQRSRLERSAIRDYISEIIVSEEIGFAKPAREYFDVAFARAGQPAKETVLMIGDNWDSDIQGAVQYGIDACWYNPGRRPRPGDAKIAREITDLKELPLWLEGKSA